VEADDDEMLILDELTNYIEVISNIDFEKWLKAMKSKMDSIYTNQVWTLVAPSERINPIGCK
jgi:hypothetical protein